MKDYMSEKKAKKAIIDIGQRMYVRNFVAANDGNISIKTGDNEVWATPTGVSKGFMKKSMLVKVDLDGNINHLPSLRCILGLTRKITISGPSAMPIHRSAPALPLRGFLWIHRYWRKR